jgi:hypothetical protein
MAHWTITETGRRADGVVAHAVAKDGEALVVNAAYDEALDYVEARIARDDTLQEHYIGERSSATQSGAMFKAGRQRARDYDRRMR